jgi:hypothetical protein
MDLRYTQETCGLRPPGDRSGDRKRRRMPLLRTRKRTDAGAQCEVRSRATRPGGVVVTRQLPKLKSRVRFPVGALNLSTVTMFRDRVLELTPGHFRGTRFGNPAETRTSSVHEPASAHAEGRGVRAPLAACGEFSEVFSKVCDSQHEVSASYKTRGFFTPMLCASSRGQPRPRGSLVGSCRSDPRKQLRLIATSTSASGARAQLGADSFSSWTRISGRPPPPRVTQIQCPCSFHLPRTDV